MKQVAIITRTKNRPLLLERALNSIVSQTYKDYVLVVVNDGGDKKPVEELIAKYSPRFSAMSEVKVMHNEKSKGMEAASNRAIKSVDSKYVAIHDDDDTWAKEFLEITVAHLETTEAMGAVVTTDRVDEEIDGSEVKQIAVTRWQPDLNSINLYKMCLDNFATPITFIYRREVHKTIGYYDETMTTGADWYFALNFLLHFDIDFLPTDKALAFYHHRPKTKGVNANSVYSLQHEKNLTALKNKLLREDITRGKLGLGYIINSIHYTHEQQGELKQVTERQSLKVHGLENELRNQAAIVNEQFTEVKKLVIERTSLGAFVARGYKFIKTKIG